VDRPATGATLVDQRPELQVGVPVEPSVRLVEQQQRRIGQQREAQIELGQRAAGELVRPGRGEALEAERVVDRSPTLPLLLRGHAVGAAEQLEVLVAGQPWVDQWLLRAVADLAPPGDCAGVGPQVSDQDPHQRRLPGAVLADQADDLALLEGDLRPGQNPDPASR
jgi:hypothetical protein